MLMVTSWFVTTTASGLSVREGVAAIAFSSFTATVTVVVGGAAGFCCAKSGEIEMSKQVIFENSFFIENVFDVKRIE